MKILVLSDSHGNVAAMQRCVEQIQPQHVLFLGDRLRDAEHLQELFPVLPMDTVPGNCDFGSLDEPERLIELDGVRILMMHGHTRDVKNSGMSAYYAAKEMGADILLYGHTHMSLVDYDGTLYTMNPGAIGERYRSSYGVITIAGGKVDCSVYRL